MYNNSHLSAVRNNPQLWERAKAVVVSDGKIWSARKAQQAVALYKSWGGTYRGSVPRQRTSLHKWTKEDWGYVGGQSKRYLPKKVRQVLTPTEKKQLSRGKKLNHRKAYGVPSVVRKMRKARIF